MSASSRSSLPTDTTKSYERVERRRHNSGASVFCDVRLRTTIENDHSQTSSINAKIMMTITEWRKVVIMATMSASIRAMGLVTG